uniref:Phosphatidylinositol-3,4,5-trisphosphate 3-phosphatase n=1 Tax=Romanomermis culicivorax TaxID=13658 RepID=A0A915IP37_ROMCU
ALLLIKSEFLQKSCCSSLKKHDHNRSRGLQLIDISTADKLHALAGTLVKPGQKLCPGCRDDIPKCEAQLTVMDLNPSDDTDFTIHLTRLILAYRNSALHPLNFELLIPLSIIAQEDDEGKSESEEEKDALTLNYAFLALLEHGNWKWRLNKIRLTCVYATVEFSQSTSKRRNYSFRKNKSELRQTIETSGKVSSCWIGMTNVVRELCIKLEKRKSSQKCQLYDILPNVIAMGFPAEKMEAWYRNDRKDFKEYMNERHKSCYKVYNLCKEKNYDIAAFENRVECYPFVDHQPPRFDTILPFCQSVEQWLKANEDNVVAVHCKAGKGRTGVMISSYLLYAGVCKTATEALEFFAKKRTYDERGVTIPSQRCYVHYFEKLLREGLTYRPVKVELKAIHVQGLYLKKMMPSKLRVYANRVHTIVVPGSTDTRIIFDRPIALQGDVRVKFIYDSGLVAR